MPTVHREGPYRFFWYSADRRERPHVHVEREKKTAKFWFDTVELERNNGFSRKELTGFVASFRRSRWLGWRGGDVSLDLDKSDVRVRYVAADDESLTVALSDGRRLLMPLDWYPRLKHGTPAERNNWRIIGRGEGVHWPDLDEDLSVEGFLAGRKSNESRESLKQWLEARDRKRRRKTA